MDHSLHEFNPMMGHRGCRLAVTYPEIAKMQTTAVIRAAIKVKNAHPDWAIKPEIMIPLVGDVKELKYVKKFVVETADAEIKAAGANLEYEVGTMIEIPRAALTADEISASAVSTTTFLTYFNSFTSHTSGIMISGFTVQSECFFCTLIAARITAFVCILAISG